jgi:hypothetical protein
VWLRGRATAALATRGALVSAVVWVAASHSAAILQAATSSAGGKKGHASLGGFNFVPLVSDLTNYALIVVVGLAPLAIAWGAGSMLFGGRHGPQIMGGAIVAVVLVAASHGIAA